MAAFRYLSRKILLNHHNTNPILQINLYVQEQRRFASILQYEKSRDPAPVFFSKPVQDLLITLTRPDLGTIYRKRKLGSKRLSLPVYKFMSEDQLKKVYQEAQDTAKDLIQMPPVVLPRETIDEVVSDDPALQGLETARIVFTDISFGVNNAHRFITVREPNGTLRKADWEIRDRMNQIYFPIVGREIRKPMMFEEEYLKPLLEKSEYSFVLDRACLQFEPDDAEYHRVTERTYSHLNEHDGFDSLRSTRHFGPLSFFLAWFNIADNLMIELLETGYLNEAAALVHLYCIVHKLHIDGEGENLVANFVEKHSTKRGSLEMALQTFRELEKERKELKEGLKAAHGN